MYLDSNSFCDVFSIESHDLILIFKIIFSHRSGDTKINIFPQTQVETISMTISHFNDVFQQNFALIIKTKEKLQLFAAFQRPNTNFYLKSTAAANIPVGKYPVKWWIKRNLFR